MVLTQGDDPSEESVRLMRDMAARGKELLSSYSEVVARQDTLLEAAESEGIELEPAWNPEEQKEIVEAYQQMVEIGESY